MSADYPTQLEDPTQQNEINGRINLAFENDSSFREENNSSRIFVIPLPDTCPETPPPSYESILSRNLRTSGSGSAPAYNLTSINDPPPLYRLVVPNPPKKYLNRNRRSQTLANITVPIAESSRHTTQNNGTLTSANRNNCTTDETPSTYNPPAELMAAVNRRAKRSRQFDLCREGLLNTLHFLAVAIIPLYNIIASLIQVAKCFSIFGAAFVATLLISAIQIFGCGSLFYAKLYPRAKFSEKATRYAGLILRLFFVAFLVTTYFVMSLPQSKVIKNSKVCEDCKNDTSSIPLSTSKPLLTTTPKVVATTDSLITSDESFCYDTVRLLMRLGIWFTWGLLPLYIFVYIYLPSFRPCWVDR